MSAFDIVMLVLGELALLLLVILIAEGAPVSALRGNETREGACQQQSDSS